MGKGSITADMGCFHTEETAFIDGCANHAVANLFIHGDGFACNRAFIHGGGAFDDFAVYGDTLPGAHHDDIPNGNLLHGNFNFLAILHDGCHLGCQIHQLADCFGGFALGACLHIFPDRNQRQNHCCALQIQLHGVMMRRHKVAMPHIIRHGVNRKDAVDIGCGRAERYQRVHVGSSVPKRLKADNEKFLIDD